MELLVYLEGNSLVHRSKPIVKLVIFALFSILIYSFNSLFLQTFAIASVCVIYRLAKIPLLLVLKKTKFILLIFGIIFLSQIYFSDYVSAISGFTRLVTLMLLALIINFTTRVSDMVLSIESVLSPLTFLGINHKKISLAITLSIRFIPLVAEIIQQIRMAQKSKGSDRSVLLLITPIIINTLKMADNISDAISARSFD